MRLPLSPRRLTRKVRPSKLVKRHTRKLTRKVHPKKMVRRQVRKLNPARKVF